MVKDALELGSGNEDEGNGDTIKKIKNDHL